MMEVQNSPTNDIQSQIGALLTSVSQKCYVTYSCRDLLLINADKPPFVRISMGK